MRERRDDLGDIPVAAIDKAHVFACRNRSGARSGRLHQVRPVGALSKIAANGATGAASPAPQPRGVRTWLHRYRLQRACEEPVNVVQRRAVVRSENDAASDINQHV
jgi:hypothetical protein